MFKPVGEPKTHLYDKVVLQIKAAVAGGDLKPGDKLPPERELAEIFGVSRTIVREATKILAATGLIDVKHGHGIFVAQTDVGQVLVPVFDRSDSIKELFEIRKVLETQTASWVALRATDDQVRTLVDTIAAVEKEIESRQRGKLLLLGEHDTKFHLDLAEATGNRVMVRLTYQLLDICLRTSRLKVWSIPGRPMRSLGEHKEILEAIAAREPELAHRAMYIHLDNVEKDILTVE